MIIQKLDKYSIVSAFIQWIVLGIVISYSNVFGLESWLNGLVVSVFSSFPIVVLVMKEDRKSVPVILFMSTLLGSIVGSLENTLRL